MLKQKHMKISFLSITICLLLTTLASQAQFITLSVESTKQGKFKGESLRSKQADKAELAGYFMEITSPRDAASGAASGRKVFQPVVLLKATGASSPQFMSALGTNELLKKVVIEFWKTDPSGMEVNYYTVTLENVVVSGFKQMTGPLELEKFNPANNAILYDEIKLSYQRITQEDKINKTMATEDAAIR